MYAKTTHPYFFLSACPPASIWGPTEFILSELLL